METGDGCWIDFLDMENAADRQKVYDLQFENFRLEEQNIFLKIALIAAVIAAVIMNWPW